MKAKIFSLVSVLLIFSLCTAQVLPDEFGTVKPEYLSMKSYAGDDLAEAVVLYDYGRTYFYDSDYGFRIIFERTTKIKILTKAGIDFAKVEIPYFVENDQMERVYDIDGYTFNFDEASLKRTRLDSKITYDEKVNDHWMVKKFAMPDVKEGSVIEFRYKIISPYFVNLHDWEFQRRIPTIYSEYTVGMIPFYEYSYIFQGARKFDVFKNTQSALKRNFNGIEYPDNNYTFGMKNIPAFRDEAYITSINDYLMKMDFQLAVIHHPNGADVDYITTWPLLIDKLLKEAEFGVYVKSGAKNAGDLIPSLVGGSMDAKARAEAIFNYVKGNYSWDGFNSKYAAKSVKDFIKTKTGNSADINLFLCGLLNAAGLEAYPVILSTRSHGKVPVDFPFQQFLNYVIVKVNAGDKTFLLDATEPLAPFGMLPARCINEKGLTVKKDASEWVPLIDDAASFETDSVKICLNATFDSLTVSTSIFSDGHTALDLRRSYFADRDDFTKSCVSGDMTITGSVNVINPNEITKPFGYNYEARVPLEKVGDKILVTPFPGMVPTENPLKVGFRNYPVDMIYAEANNFYSEINIPKGYNFAEDIKEVQVDNALVRISYTARPSADKLIITGSYFFKKAIYLQNEYFELKRMFTTIVETFNKKIILHKNTV